MKLLSSNRFCWALYDWANSAVATCVITVFFPLVYAEYFSGKSSAESSVGLALASQISGIAIAFGSPIFGAFADSFGKRRPFLLTSVGFGVLSLILLSLTPAGSGTYALLLFCVVNISFSASLIFYDSLLPVWFGRDEQSRVSAYGYALGYLGGGIHLALVLGLVLSGGVLGLHSLPQVGLFAFVFTALWWSLFSIPLMLRLKRIEDGQRATDLALSTRVFDAVFSIVRIGLQLCKKKHILLFLVAYWLYIDGVNTIIRLAVDFGNSLVDQEGVKILKSADLIQAILLTQFVAFPSALFFGWLGTKFSTARGIFLGLVIFFASSVCASQLSQRWEFYVLAVLIGSCLGGVQALSRAHFSRLVGEGSENQLFGWYNLITKAGVLIGPGMYALGTYLTGSQRSGVGAVSALFLIGGIILVASVRLEKTIGKTQNF